MKPTGKYVIFREDRDEFLAAERRVHEADLLGWAPTPAAAVKYDALSAAQQTAQRIADKKGYGLTVCELHESATQMALKDSVRVYPSRSRR